MFVLLLQPSTAEVASERFVADNGAFSMLLTADFRQIENPHAVFSAVHKDGLMLVNCVLFEGARGTPQSVAESTQRDGDPPKKQWSDTVGGADAYFLKRSGVVVPSAEEKKAMGLPESFAYDTLEAFVTRPDGVYVFQFHYPRQSNENQVQDVQRTLQSGVRWQ